MKTNVEIRALALDQMKGNWRAGVIITLIYVAIEAVASGSGLIDQRVGTTVYSLIYILGLYPLAFGFYTTFLSLCRDSKPLAVESFFEGFTKKYFAKAIVVQLLVAIFVALWSLLLIVPGIIKACAYLLAPFIVAENPNTTAMEAIQLSEKMMDGHKADYFWLQLTFVGWGILCFFTFGIGYFWLIPYMQASVAQFYEEVKADYEQKRER